MNSNSSYVSLAISFVALTLALAGVILPQSETPQSGSFAPYPVLNFDSFPTLAVGGHWTQTTFSGDVLYGDLYITTRRIHVVQLKIAVYVAGDAGSQCRMGIYGDNGQQYPGALVVDAGLVATDGVGYKTITIDVWLDAGYYYFATLGSVNFFTNPSLARTTVVLTHVVSGTQYVKSPYTFGALPNPFPAGGTPSLANWGVMWKIDAYE